MFHPVKIVDRTGLFKGIVFPLSERTKMRQKLRKRWGQDSKKRTRKVAEQRRELAMLRGGSGGRYGAFTAAWGREDETSNLGVGKMAEGLVREMMSQGSEEDRKLDLGYFLDEAAREQQEGGLT